MDHPVSRRSLKDSERIVAVASLFQGQLYTLPPPARHHDLVRLIAEKTGVAYVGGETYVQGFIDQDGFFLRRKPAKLVAERANQILDNRAPKLDDLYSENLW